MLNRARILVKIINSGNLNYSYQYDLMKILYKAAEITNADANKFIHEVGYKVDNKKFKLFSFALIFKEKPIFQREYISLKEGSTAELIISGKEEILNIFLKGLLLMETFSLNNITFKICELLEDKKINFKKYMLYKSISPIVESIYNVETKVVYLNPLDKDYYKALAQNLKRKYKAIYQKEYLGDIYFDIDNLLKIKKVNIGVRNGAIRGYKCDIWIQAEPDMQKVVYYCGLGQNNSVGAGFLTYITGRNRLQEYTGEEEKL